MKKMSKNTYLTPIEYAKKHKIAKQTVYMWLKLGKFKKSDLKIIKVEKTLIKDK